MNNVNSVFILWQDKLSKLWHPIAKLTYSSKIYRLNYTKGAEKSKQFAPFPGMNDLHKVYKSSELFPFFSNRILPSSRPEFKHVIRWLDLNPDSFNAMEYLGITGGARQTDNYRIIKLPAIENNNYVFKFLVSGIQYLSNEEQTAVNNLKSGDKLEFNFEVTNPIDINAIKLVDSKSKLFVGYCPRYLVSDFKKLIETSNATGFNFSVNRLNIDAPSAYRLVCEFRAPSTLKYSPLLMDEYFSITNDNK